MKVVCWDCWTYSIVRGTIDSRCKKCGSANITPVEDDIFEEYGPEDVIDFFGVKSKWELVKIYNKERKFFTYRAFWTNPILQKDYKDVFFIVEIDKNNPKNYRYGIVYTNGEKYFKCVSDCKNNHIKKPEVKEISKKEFEKITIKGENGELSKVE